MYQLHFLYLVKIKYIFDTEYTQYTGDCLGFGKLEFAALDKTIQIAGQKFAFHILASLLQSRHGKGFNALLKEIPSITPRTLSLRLKELEAGGLVSKNISVGPKIRIEYRLTEKGERFEAALDGLAKTGSLF